MKREIPDGKPFEPGREKTGGRLKGSRNKLTKKFVEALCDDFEQHGEEAIRITRVEHPEQYLRVIAAILPKELDINDNRLKEIPDDELDLLIELAKRRVAASRGTGELDDGEVPALN